MQYAKANIPTSYGEFNCIVFRDSSYMEHVALVKGTICKKEHVLCRIHSECLTGEVFGSLKCDCKQQLDLALKTISEVGCGVLLYLRQEGRGIGLGNKIKAYALQEGGADTVDANLMLGLPNDTREYGPAAKMLKMLEVSSIVLMTNNPDKVNAMKKANVKVSQRKPHEANVHKEALAYLKIKKEKMGHLLSIK
ncbi:GTP cyclohydrolase II [Sulfobacillus acidophilus]|uniref:GTP cyclohydrolase-2 n=1 Tax=Sulfobacillus acidophilus TaxID=53633 RepID=A0ABS3AVJ4_9FIRM|nr:GTP cyclohydrolase II [Sulfobacillus acidophilus]